MILSFSNKQVDTMAERMTAVAMPIIASLTKDLQTRLFMDVMLPEVLYLKFFLERHGLWLSIWIFQSVIYRDFSSSKKEFLMTSLICDGHLQTCPVFYM